MKALLLSAGSSIHTARWVNGLAGAGVKVCLATQHSVSHDLRNDVDLIECPYRGYAGYLTMSARLRRIVRTMQPDILNAHFASGYGTTGRLIDFHPYVLSVWGSDVYSFPERSKLHRWLVSKNLRAADVIASTSHCMADQVRSVVPGVGQIPITPFGIDLGLFSSVPVLSKSRKDTIVIGTVKAMEETYGIDTLLKAFDLLHRKLVFERHPLAHSISLRLVGGGSQKRRLEDLARQLGIRDLVNFVGQVPHSGVPGEIAELDVYVALSRQESFGVAVLEAGAAGRPVVVSDAGGLAEVVRHGITGVVVPRDNPRAAANAILDLVDNPEKRIAMGEAGRRHVRDNYAWEECVQKMLSVYEDTLRKFGPKSTDT